MVSLPDTDRDNSGFKDSDDQRYTQKNTKDDLPGALQFAQRNGLIPPGNKKVDMFISEEELNIILGDALMPLLADNADISAEILSAQLKQMLETENDIARRQLIKKAISLTHGFFSGAGSTGYAEYGSAKDNQSQSPGQILPWRDRKH